MALDPHDKWTRQNGEANPPTPPLSQRYDTTLSPVIDLLVHLGASVRKGQIFDKKKW